MYNRLTWIEASRIPDVTKLLKYIYIFEQEHSFPVCKCGIKNASDGQNIRSLDLCVTIPQTIISAIETIKCSKLRPLWI